MSPDRSSGRPWLSFPWSWLHHSPAPAPATGHRLARRECKLSPGCCWARPGGQINELSRDMKIIVKLKLNPAQQTHFLTLYSSQGFKMLTHSCLHMLKCHSIVINSYHKSWHLLHKMLMYHKWWHMGGCHWYLQFVFICEEADSRDDDNVKHTAGLGFKSTLLPPMHICQILWGWGIGISIWYNYFYVNFLALYLFIFFG